MSGRWEGPYVEGERHGPWVESHMSGRWEGPYVEGERHGDWVVRNRKGKKFRRTYVNGKRVN